MTILGYTVIFILCLLLEAFSSGSEIALIAANTKKIRKAKHLSPQRIKITLKLLKNRERLLATTLCGTNLAVVTNMILVTFLAIDLGALMGGAIITETIFNLPGIGRAVYEGVQRQEGTVVVGIATFMIVVYMVANLIADILYGILDPRIRYD